MESAVDRVPVQPPPPAEAAPQVERHRITRFIGYWACLSNFFPCDVEGVNGWRFPSLEHAYQAEKVDPGHAEAQGWYRRIYKANTPVEARRLGRAAPLRADWADEEKLRVMKRLLRRKFAYPLLRTMLLETQDAELVEGNTHGDRFWGSYMEEGENHLGKLLMEVREETRAQATE
jgi:hypothetical protein